MDKRSQILDFAERATRSNGCNSFSFEHIARDVGLNKSSLYHYFESKQELIRLTFRRYYQMIGAVLQDISSSDMNAAEQMLAYIEANKGLVEEGNSVCLSVALGLENERLEPEIRADLKRFHQLNINWLVQTYELAQQDGSIPNVIDPKEEAYACLALMDGAQLMARLQNDESFFDRAVSQFKASISAQK